MIEEVILARGEAGRKVIELFPVIFTMVGKKGECPGDECVD